METLEISQGGGNKQYGNTYKAGIQRIDLTSSETVSIFQSSKSRHLKGNLLQFFWGCMSIFFKLNIRMNGMSLVF